MHESHFKKAHNSSHKFSQERPFLTFQFWYGFPSQHNRWVLSTCSLTPRASLGLATWHDSTSLLRFGQLKVWQNLTQNFQTTYRHLPIPHYAFMPWIRQLAPNLYPLLNLRQALRCNSQTRGALTQVFPCYLSDQKQSWCSSLFLQDVMTIVPTASTSRFYPATPAEDCRMLWWASGRP